jgi:DnaJ-domain-containing protein 1
MPREPHAIPARLPDGSELTEMAPRSSASHRRLPSDLAVVLAWYVSAILAYGGALSLIDHWRPPHARYAVAKFDRETCIALACWLAGIASLYLIQSFIDRQLVQYLTILPFGFSWYLCLAAMIGWLGEEPADVGHTWPAAVADHEPETHWWFYPLQFALIGSPAPAWLLTFRSMHRRERGELLDSIRQWATSNPFRPRRGFVRVDARLGGLLDSHEKPRRDRQSSTRHDGPRPGSMRGFDSPQLRDDLGTLGVKSGATREEIRQAYRALVLTWHPDRFPHDPDLRVASQQKMIEINSAYDRIERRFGNRSGG